MNENFTLTAFTEPITDLADQPNLPPEEMKRRLQAPAEELRLAHNALCDDTARLSDRVSGIITETFGDAIPKSMLADELQAEIDAKAEQADLVAEQTAREALAGAVAQKCEVYFGVYIGDGQSTRIIELGFQPSCLIAVQHGYLWSYGNGETYGALAFPDHLVRYMGASSYPVALEILENGFRVANGNRTNMNINGEKYHYIAFR